MSEVPYWLTSKYIDYFSDYELNEPFFGVDEQIKGGQSVDLSSVRRKSHEPITDGRGRVNTEAVSLPSQLKVDGACNKSQVEFIGLSNYRSRTKRRKIEAAKIVCSKCVVRDVCLEFGEKVVTVDTDPCEIYGGLTAKEILDNK